MFYDIKISSVCRSVFTVLHGYGIVGFPVEEFSCRLECFHNHKDTDLCVMAPLVIIFQVSVYTLLIPAE